MRALLLAAVVCAIALSCPHSATACGAFFRERSPSGDADDIELAEELVARGDLDGARALMGRTFAVGQLRQARMVDRTLRVLARIAIRSPIPSPSQPDGAIDAYEQRVRWAVRTLSLLARDGADPVVLSDLGEALALLPDQQDVALFMLDTLAERDLVASAEGYAALARLRQLAGRQLEAAHALERCRLMALVPERACGWRERVIKAVS